MSSYLIVPHQFVKDVHKYLHKLETVNHKKIEIDPSSCKFLFKDLITLLMNGEISHNELLLDRPMSKLK